MIAEPFVLVREKHFEETRIDFTLGDRQPPSPLARRIGAQESPFPIKHDVRIFELAKRRRSERKHPDRAYERRRGDEPAGNR